MCVFSCFPPKIFSCHFVLQRELKTLGDNSIVPAGRTSAFYAVNLHGAIELANVKYNDESNEKKNEILQNTFARKCDVVKGTVYFTFNP